MERANKMFGMRDIRFGPQGLIEPMTLFGPSASVFNLRELSLSAVHVDCDDASVCFQNLRKLELQLFPKTLSPLVFFFLTIDRRASVSE
jgi:hypothetical protein